MRRGALKLITLSTGVGLAAGLGAVAFRWLISTAHWFFFTFLAGNLDALGPWAIVVAPAAGGLVVGPLVHFFAREAKGHGVPEVMNAVALKGGRIRPIVAVIKSLASAACIGSGGSVGREGPIVQIGSAVGSALGQWLGQPERTIKLLVAGGAAGGISATFNAPIAGVIFALEVILGEFSAQNFGYVVLASVTSAAVARSMLGDHPAFAVPEYHLVSVFEIGLYAVLGVLCALIGIAYTKLIYLSEDLFEKVKLPPWFLPVTGGVLVGFLGVAMVRGGLFVQDPDGMRIGPVFGVGYETIERVLGGGATATGAAVFNPTIELTVQALLILAAAKVLATALTLGSGGSGGVFAPALYIGATFGAAFGKVVQQLGGGWVDVSGGYAMVGMAAVFAAATHAPITAILILFEMTGDYRIILPLMAAVVIGTLVSLLIERESIYTVKLKRRGVDIRARADVNLMAGIEVRQAMDTRFVSVNPETPVSEVIRRIQDAEDFAAFVLDARGLLAGIVTLSDISEGDLEEPACTAKDVMTRDVISCTAEETLDEVLRRPGARDVRRIPVVEGPTGRKVVGVLRRREVLSAYSRAAGEHTELLQQVRKAQIREAGGPRLINLRVQARSPADGSTLRDLAVPPGCLLVSVNTGTAERIPDGGTVLRAGDLVLAVVRPAQEKQFRALLAAPKT